MKRGFEVIHIRRRGEERHIPTACFDAYDPPPIDLVKRIYADFSRLCGGASIYLFGGALDGITNDADVVAYGVVEGLPEGYDAQGAPETRRGPFPLLRHPLGGPPLREAPKDRFPRRV